MTRRSRGRPPHPDILTPAEWRVLEELRTGGTYAEIAVRLRVSPDAIRFHVRNMRDKLNLRDRAELVAWRPSDGARRRPFRALLAPFAGLPVAARTVAGVAVAAAVGGGIVATLVLVVALRGGGEAPLSVTLPDEPTATPVRSQTPSTTSTPVAPTASAATSTPVATATPSPTPLASAEPSEPSAEASGDCDTVPSIQDLFAFWVPGPDVDLEAPAVSSTPAGPAGIGHGPSWGLGIRVHDLIAVGHVRGFEWFERPSDGQAYLVFVVEVEDVLWGAASQGEVLRLLIGGGRDEVLNWERVEAARQSLLCSKVLFRDTTWAVPSSLRGVEPEGMLTLSNIDIVLGLRDEPHIDDLAEEFRTAARQVQPRTCPLFAQGTGVEVAVVGPRARVWTTGSDAALSAASGAIRGTIVGVVGEAFVAEAPRQGALAERFLIVEVLVAERLGGALSRGDRLRLVLPVAATLPPRRVSDLLPCHDVLLVLQEFSAEWLLVSLPDAGMPLYSLQDWGLYLETRAGGILNPYVGWAWYDWVAYGPVVHYGVNVQGVAFGEFSNGLRAALAAR